MFRIVNQVTISANFSSSKKVWYSKLHIFINISWQHEEAITDKF